ncbi:MAG: hypothetical protein JOZ67_00850 [Gammaproteobacteria bacterium]|nr:hypothetical protein [Gammaproteobacteria bacterium]
MNLIDSVTQCRTPFVVRDRVSGADTVLNNAADCASAVARCPLRYVLRDDLTQLCADLAYSKGANSLACADLLHAPAESLWVEWCNESWRQALLRYGFPLRAAAAQWVGRRGAWIRASRDGRRGLVRTFWNVTSGDVLAGSVEAYFDFDTPQGEDPEPFVDAADHGQGIYDSERSGDDILERCFRFRYERSWADYYRGAGLAAEASAALWRHALGTIAMDVPMLLAFFLLLAARNGVPQQPQSLEALNRRRIQRGKAPLLDHIVVSAPIVQGYRHDRADQPHALRSSPRLHHVRGHLVRRGSQIFWRVPHLRGSARSGSVRTRTVTWTFGRETAGLH